MATGYSRILAVIDPQAATHPALSRAARFTASAGEIHVFTALFDPALSGDHFFDSKRLRKSRTAYLQRTAKAVGKLARAALPGRAKVRADVAWGKPFYRLVLERVAELDPDLLILGQLDPSGARYTNTELHLIRTCPSPLLIARHRAWADRPLAVAAIDPAHRHDKPAALDRKIIELTHRFSQALKGDYRVFFAYDAATLAELGIRGVAAESRLKQLIKKLAVSKLSARQIELAEAKPVEAISDYVELRDPDVLVLGSVSRSLIGRALIGGTAEKLISRVACDLLIVKPAGFVPPV